MARAVTVIPPSISTRFSNLAPAIPVQRKVAAYARVSTDSEEQLTSYEAQVDYYTKYIKERADWDFVFVYTDEGISGTNTKKRDGFNQMIKDAMDGEIDLIITKSVSRFARNTVDSLTAVRKLKDKGVEVYFEKENIYTFDGKGELLITIMSSLAQEESRSISENITWGKRKSAADGNISLPYKQFLGYEKGENGLPQIIEKEAAIIRLIYKQLLEGKTPTAIAKYLTAHGIPTPSGRPNWRCGVVESILTNEKYKGDAVLQKTFTTDFLTKKKKVNEGEVPQYYVEHSHEAIIPADEFDMVQTELARRKAMGRSYRCTSCFASKIVCGDCGSFFGPKVWHSTSKYRRTIWQCNRKFKDGDKCATPHIMEDALKDGFITAWNSLLEIRSEVIGNCRIAITTLCTSDAIDAELAGKNSEVEVLTELTRKHIEENASLARNQETYQERYNDLLAKYTAATERVAELMEIKEKRKTQQTLLTAFVNTLEHRQKLLDEFDEALWLATVEKATVFSNGKITFYLINGTKIEA